MRDDHRRSEHGAAGLMFGLLGLLLAAVIGVIVSTVTVSRSSSNGTNGKRGSSLGPPFTGPTSSVPGGSSAGSGIASVPPAAQIASCQADARSLAVALQAYDAVNGVFPTPSAPWSAAAYAANFAPLTTTTTGGSFMRVAPSTTHYVVEYDSSGNVWVEPPGQYDAAYNPARSMDVATACASVVK
jgi:hypothetical protein